MNNKIERGTILYHPCSLDIIEHRVVGINQFTNDEGTITRVQRY